MSKQLLQNNTGLSAFDLAAALTSEQWANLDLFALKRLRRAASSPQRQRVLTLLCPRSLGHAAIERFALADVGLPGRKLKPHQRMDAAAFMHALRGAINSMISHALTKVEFNEEHLVVGSEETDCESYEPQNQTNLPEELELRDLERHLFARLEAGVGENEQLKTAVESLRDDCVTGHSRGINGEGVTTEAKRQVRQQAQHEWKNLNPQ